MTADQPERDKPEIDFPDFAPPSELVIDDLIEGEGEEAVAGSTVQVHYVGVAHSTGEEFDASYNRGAPLEFRLGVGQVISGWDTGVQGMRVGGRRQLVIPPHLAYGDRGAGGVIRPGETLIFVCDLIDVR
jgi:peptidylprolyl isomerase